MDVLVIGGTRFLGRHITDALLARGHRVTHFNRGQTAPDAADGIPTIHGDRMSDLARTGDARWDAVIDTCAYTPDAAEISARFFEMRTSRYMMISTISVYDEEQTDGPDEEAAVHELPQGVDSTQFTVEHYGALKVLCEAAIRNVFRERAIILRAGLIAGPYDPTDRFTYWPLRVAAGGEVAAPVAESEPVQYIDARDLADFAVLTIEQGVDGTYNCVTPRDTLTFGALFAACLSTSHARCTFRWMPANFLAAHHVEPWSGMPLWIPSEAPERAIVRVDSARALARGLRVRPIEQTVRDTARWAESAGKGWGTLSAGLSPATETALNAAFQERLTNAVK